MQPEAKARLLRRSIREQAPFWLEVTGQSMGNTIHAGSHVLLDDAPRPRLGEIWAWCSDDATVVVHRSLGRGPGGYRFQGDARIDADPPVPPDRIIGRVRAVRYRDQQWRVGPRDRVLKTTRLLALRGARTIYRWLPDPIRRRLAPLQRLIAGRLR